MSGPSALPPPDPVRIEGSDGLFLALREWSDDGPPLLFVHGFGHDSHVWEEIVPAVAGRRRVLTLDLRGHGESDVDPEFRYHHANLGRDLKRVVEELDLHDLVLVAHSTAGHAAIGYAARAGDRVARLVLVDAGPELRATGGGGERAGSDRADGSFDDRDAYLRFLARSYPRASAATRERLATRWLREREDGRVEPRLDPRFLRQGARRTAGESSSDEARSTGPSFDRRAWAEQGEKALWDELARVTCPTLVVRGGASPMLSAGTVERMVAEGLADGRAVTIPDAGHALVIEAPTAFREALRSFLEEAP